MSMTDALFDAEALAARLTSRFGIGLILVPPPASAAGQGAEPAGTQAPLFIRATDIEPPNGFCIRLSVNWRSVEAAFLPDKYAGALIRSMGDADSSSREATGKLAETFTAAGNRLALRVNNVPVSSWTALPPPHWQQLELSVVRMSDAADAGGTKLISEVEEVATACLALILSQVPLEDASDQAPVPLFEAGLPEGAKTRVEVNRHERSPVNRAACIAFFGARCQACGFDFSSVYGEIGEGYIEVHHLTPVSRMLPGYVVNPQTDLVPLCSNCHAIVHRHHPPLGISELKGKIEFCRSKPSVSPPRH